MKIHFTIELDDALVLAAMRGAAEPRPEIRPAPKSVPAIPPVTPKLVAELKATPMVDGRVNSGPRMEPGFIALVAAAPEPFTRAALAAVSGLGKSFVTQRLNRMKVKGWVESPASGLWRRTKTFAR